MGISKENLGAAVEEIKLSGDESYSSKADLGILSDKVDNISIAQKTVNKRGIKELLEQETIFSMGLAAANGTAKETLVDKTINLVSSIEDYNFLQIYAKVNGETRKFKYNATTIDLPIVYNNSNTINLQDNSTIYIICSQGSSEVGAFGAFHFALTVWFKSPTQLYIRSVFNPLTSVEYNSFSITSIKGIKMDGVIIDPVEYVNTTQGIEDSPVGTIISILGNEAPKHYIQYDNTELNIAEYPHLAEYIRQQFGSYNYFGGDGINTFSVTDVPLKQDIIDVTPTMTSNILPTPYVASGSTQNGKQAPYMAFDGYIDKFPGAFEPKIENGNYGWLKLDFGEKKLISGFFIKSYTSNLTNDLTRLIKSFTLYASNDDISYTEIKTFDTPVWTFNTRRDFDLEKNISYRYYRINIISNYGLSLFTTIPELRYYLKVKDVKYIKYEPTYFMNIHGLIEETTLWEGNIGSNSKDTTSNIIDLNDSIENYDKIGVHFHAILNSVSYHHQYKEIPCEEVKRLIDLKDDRRYISFILGYGYDAITADFSSIDSSLSTYNKFAFTQANSRVTKIIGIKYKTFQKTQEGSN